jgi:uncharacterized repeat protein (TIGR02543 family)
MKFRKILLYLVFLFSFATFISCGNTEIDTPNIKETYVVTFETNGGTIIENIEVDENGKIVPPTDPTKDGYIFVGWYSDSNLTKGIKIDVNIFTKDKTVYAKWKEAGSVIVSFQENGGSAVDNITVDYGQKISLPKDPIKTGYTFEGWYIDKSLSTKFDVNTQIKSNITLYAKWTKKAIDISLGNNVSEGESYYGVVAGLVEDDLSKALHNLLEDTHTKHLSYSDIWDILKVADKGEGENVVCIYTGVLHAFSKKDNGTSGNDLWNREHLWPNSKGFGNKSHTAYSDAHHLFASNKNINATRGNKDFVDFELLGISSSGEDKYGNKWDSNYFEPRDEVKGDIARALFYMVIRYNGDTCDDCTLDLELVFGSSAGASNTYDKVGKLGDLESLIKWHYEDPVSDSERARNEVVYEWQGNRNPFIDHPEFVYGIYGKYAEQYVN